MSDIQKKKVKVRNTTTGSVMEILVQVETNPANGQIISIRAGLAAGTIEIWNNQGTVTNCIVNPPSGDISWNPDFTLPPGVAGTLYEVLLPLSALIPAAGQTAARITDPGGGLPAFLSVVERVGEVSVLRGTLPLGITKLDVSLLGVQSDGKTALKRFNDVPVVTGTLYVYLFAYKDSKQLFPIIGGDGLTTPVIQIVDGPPGYDSTTFTCPRFGAKVGSTDYFFACDAYKPIAFGEYAFKITHQGITKYFKYKWTGAEDQLVPTLLGTQPSVDNGTTTTPPPAGITVVAVDNAYTPPIGSELNFLYTYVKLSASDFVEIAYQQLNAAGAQVLPKTNYFTASSYSDALGYLARDIMRNVDAQVRLFVRPASNPSAEVQILFIRPSSAVSRFTSYPSPQTTPWIADTDSGPDLYDEVPSSPPGWASPLRYSYEDGHLLTIEATSSIGRVKFERADGVSFSTTNPDGVLIQSGNFYYSGVLSGQGQFTRRWQINLGIYPMKVTVEQADGSATYPYFFIPISGVVRASLTVPLP